MAMATIMAKVNVKSRHRVMIMVRARHRVMIMVRARHRVMIMVRARHRVMIMVRARFTVVNSGGVIRVISTARVRQQCYGIGYGEC